MTRLALALALAMPSVAAAEPQCKPDRHEMLYEFANRYVEVPAAEALDHNGNTVVWLVNPQTGTWSMLTRTPGGPICLTEGGTGFSALAYAPPLAPGEQL
jgi:hypothetical protein